MESCKRQLLENRTDSVKKYISLEVWFTESCAQMSDQHASVVLCMLSRSSQHLNEKHTILVRYVQP